jgi:hypothetical protein
MTKTTLMLIISLAAATGAYAQGSSGGVTMSTDPAKIAAVEKRVQDVKASQVPTAQTKTTAKKTSTHKDPAKASSKSKSKPKHASTSAKPAPKTKAQPAATK